MGASGLVFAVVVAGAMASCAPPDAADLARQRLSDAGLDVGSSWVLVRGAVDGDELELLPERPITLERIEAGVEGQSSCNHYFSDPVEGEPATDLLLPSLATQAMDCSPQDQTLSESPVMVLEEHYLGALQASTEIEVTSDRLQIRGPTSTLVFAPMGIP